MVTDPNFSAKNGVCNARNIQSLACQSSACSHHAYLGVVYVNDAFRKPLGTKIDQQIIAASICANLNKDFIETGELWHTDSAGKPRTHYIEHPDDRRAIADQFGLS